MLQNLTIGKRLAIGFSALAILILVTGVFSALRMGNTQRMVQKVTDESVPAIRDLGRLATMLAEYRVSERGLVASADRNTPANWRKAARPSSPSRRRTNPRSAMPATARCTRKPWRAPTATSTTAASWSRP